MNSLPAPEGFASSRRFDFDSSANETRLQQFSRTLTSALMKHIAAKLPRRTDYSSAPIHVLIPVALDDLDTVLLCVQGIRRHLMHPVEKIVVVGPTHPEIKNVCDRAGVTHIDEFLLLSEQARARIRTLGGDDARRLTGELIKIAAFDYMTCETLFVCEADTILIRDQTFIADSGHVLYVADDHICGHRHAMNKRLLGDVWPHARSFATHNALFERAEVREMCRLIEARANADWLGAILGELDEDEPDSFSAYELYGTFLWNFHPEKIETRYWFNQQCRSIGPSDLRDLSQAYRGFNSVSASVRS